MVVERTSLLRFGHLLQRSHRPLRLCLRGAARRLPCWRLLVLRRLAASGDTGGLQRSAVRVMAAERIDGLLSPTNMGPSGVEHDEDEQRLEVTEELDALDGDSVRDEARERVQERRARAQRGRATLRRWKCTATPSTRSGRSGSGASCEIRTETAKPSASSGSTPTPRNHGRARRLRAIFSAARSACSKVTRTATQLTRRA